MVIEKVGVIKRLTLPGGVKKRSESLEKSLVRESAEEIGLSIDRFRLTHLVSSVRSKEETIIVKHHFVTRLVTNSFQVIETEKFKDVYWVYWKDALPFLDKEDKKAVKKYFKSNYKKKTKATNYESSISSSIAM
ncbi:NUDIX hydrolase [Kordia sp. SMS9]|uniref:NUDIX hydrolase n=1 Tax=Kordia sp. SMS9 TaxID=2282170 RepID=UPI0013B3A615|nr:NUDIX hydrolase [Kordia sp. SMS9]